MELHRPVMPAETLEQLAAARGGLFVDTTLGLGGHAELILRASPNNRVIGFDRHAEAIELSKRMLIPFGERFTAIHTDFRRIKEALSEKGIGTVAGILADLGVSSYQLDTPERGFSFRPGQGVAGSPPLDMRMDRSQKLSA